VIFRVFQFVGIVAFLFGTPNVGLGQKVDFESEIVPILANKCLKCHNSGLDDPKGGLSFDTAEELRDWIGHDGVIVPGNPAESEWLQVMGRELGDDKVMPPARENNPVTEQEQQLIASWIRQGASLGSFEAYQAEPELEQTVVPRSEARDVQAAAARIDQLIAEGLAKHDKQPNPMAGDDVFLRRAYLNLAGRNPSAREVHGFLSDRQLDKRSRLINMLLESPGYTSHAFNYWCDALRVQSEVRQHGAEHFEIWLKRSLADNKPYDAMVREMLVAKGRAWDTPEAGFYFRDIKNRLAGVEATAGLFLGTQIGCAQCHDHPYDRWTQRDYYSFAAFYLSRTGFVRREEVLKFLDSEMVDRQRVEMMDHSRSLFLADKLKERGEDPSTVLKPIPAFDGVSQVVRDQLVEQVDEKNFVTFCYLALATKVKLNIGVPPRPSWGRLPENFVGKDGKPGDPVPPKVLFGESPKVSKGDDLSPPFADWLVAPENPRFTKVIANRLWTWMMGASLSGKLDEVLETHHSADGKLVLYLEGLMRASDYDLKHVLRVLANTQFYGRRSVALEYDLLNPELLPGPLMRRMTAEQIWDSMILLIDTEMDSKINLTFPDNKFVDDLYRAESLDVYWQTLIDEYGKQKAAGDHPGGFINAAAKVKTLGFDQEQMLRASELEQPTPPGHLMRLFGQSDRDLIDNAWFNPTVPQALTLMNGPLFDQIKNDDSALSKTLDAVQTPQQKAAVVFMATLSRYPSAAETEIALEAIQNDDGQYAYEDLVWSIINTRQFLFPQ